MTGSSPTGKPPSSAPPKPADTPTPPDRRFDDGPGEPFDPKAPLPGEKKWHWGWLFAGIALFYCLFMAGAYVSRQSRKPPPIGPFPAATSAQPLKVYVAGWVNQPGLYELPANSRVQDAIDKAGGPRPGANLDALNLAAWAQDGSRIEVPPLGATPAPVSVSVPNPTPFAVAATPISSAPSSASNALPTPGPATTTTPEAATTPATSEADNATPDYLKEHPIDLNTATVEQLETLPGIGAKIAADIVAYRTQLGGFQNVDQLDGVKGIGEKKLARVKAFVFVK